MNNNKKNIFIITIILFIIAIIGVGTYAVLTWVSTENTELTIKIGEVAGVYFDTGPNINISNMGPIFDYEKDGEITYFTVSNYIEEELPINASLNITTISDNLKSEDFKYVVMSSSDKKNYTIVKEDNFVNVSNGTSIPLVTEDILPPGGNITYKVIIYIDGNAENPLTLINGTLSGVISVSATNDPRIDESGANYPELTENLVPVMHNGTTWVTADTTSSTSTYGWYDYNAKKWANAVLLTSTKRNSLTKDAKGNYTPGQTIGDTESAGVLAFYVWIPRYKYKVWNINKIVGTDTYNAQTKGIDIVFEEGNSTTGGVTCKYDFSKTATATVRNEECTNSGDGYYTHPAFTFGNDSLTGFWMGKFELSSSSPSTSNGGGESVTLTPRILPNVTSWRDNYVESYWKVIKDMQKASNIYGLSTDTTIVDTHMLTNMEWGAVAYLTHSKYGRCTGGTSSTCTELTINSNSSYTTGYSNSTSYPYTNANGQKASTTGNIYGVYDMSGGAWEYVMGNVSNSKGSYAYNVVSAAGGGTYYTYSGNAKYLTTYAYGESYFDQAAYNQGRLGDATSEVVTKQEYAWYGDYAYFPVSFIPWFIRGGYYNDGTLAGVFSFYAYDGYLDKTFGSRGALTVFVA